MSSRSHVQWQISCDAPSCGATYLGERGISRAFIRRLLAKRGWTTDVNSAAMRRDYCPDHKHGDAA